jgi:hypothetical protein
MQSKCSVKFRLKNFEKIISIGVTIRCQIILRSVDGKKI